MMFLLSSKVGMQWLRLRPEPFFGTTSSFFVLVSKEKRGWCRSFEKVALKRLGLRRGACM